MGLESGYQTEGEGNGTGINVIVTSVEHLGIDTFVFGDYERILNRTEQTEAEILIEEFLPGVTGGDVVAAEE